MEIIEKIYLCKDKDIDKRLVMRITHLVIIGLTFILNSCSPSNKYTTFKDVRLGIHTYEVVDKKEIPLEEKRFILATLKYYNIPCYSANNEIYILEEIYEQDINLIFNISRKARDQAWIREHLDNNIPELNN